MIKTILTAVLVLCSASAACAGAKTFGMFVSDGRTWTPIQLFDSLGDCDVKARRAYETGKYKGVGCREMSGQEQDATREGVRQGIQNSRRYR